MLKLVRSAGLCASKEETEQATTTKSTEALELGGGGHDSGERDESLSTGTGAFLTDGVSSE